MYIDDLGFVTFFMNIHCGFINFEHSVIVFGDSS
jgi:hypothetical protein